MAVRVEWTKDSGGRWKMEEVPDSEKFFSAQLVFLALGFLGPQNQVLQALNIKQDARSNVQTPAKVRASRGHTAVRHLFDLQKYSTNVEGIFAAGDCRRGQSLIVWGIKYVRFCLFCLNLIQYIMIVRVVVLQQRSTGGSVAVLVGYHLLVESRLE